MKALPIIILIYTLGATCFFIVLTFYDHDLNIKWTNRVHRNASVELAKAYPNYYEDDLHEDLPWPFNVTKNYPQSKVFEWTEPVQHENRHGLCDEGTAFVPPDGMQELMEKLQKEHNFNLLASDMISLHRSLPDPRYDECKNLLYPKKLPTTSVIIIFHDEAWTTLLRTVWSVIDRSPLELIKEIILVDDFSNWSVLKRPLDDYVETVRRVPIKVIRNSKREGLIRARLIGAQHATGQVLTFLDAHIECCEGWLQPLLARIASDRSTVAVPIIDPISSVDMSYIDNKITYINGFHWSLVFYWIPISKREAIRTNNDKTAPVRTPTMIGCAFSIDSEFFFEIGSLDEGMQIWGSENVELSVRVWRSGGSMEIIPCSHVAHLFRASTYSFGGIAEEIVSMNNIRLVEIWMPEIKSIFYAANPVSKKYSGGNMTDRITLKERLNRRDFRWYLENIFPESTLNNEFVYFGEIKSPSSDGCLDTCGGGPGTSVKIFSCHHQGGNQILGLTRTQTIVTYLDLCMCIGVRENVIASVGCNESPQWKYENETQWLVDVDSGLCMQANSSTAILKECNPDDETFKWEIISAF